MSRAGRTLVIFIVLGAAANIAIAWTCSLQPLPEKNRRLVTLDDMEKNDLWRSVADPGWPTFAGGSADMRRPGLTIRMAWSGRAEHLVQESSFGWPRRSMRWRYVRSLSGERFESVLPPAPTVNILEPMFAPTVPEGLRFALPLWPIWPGFIKNTVFLAIVIWFLSLMSPLRFVRWGRGRCEQCGYDLRGERAAGCPECGWRRAGQSRNAETP